MRRLWIRRERHLSCRCTGFRDAICGVESECRPCNGVYGHEHGRSGGRHERAESLSDGGTAAGSTATGSTEYAAASGAGTWKCECGAENTGKFCSECGKPKPQREEWICSCGAVNTGKFCSECGSPRRPESGHAAVVR